MRVCQSIPVPDWKLGQQHQLEGGTADRALYDSMKQACSNYDDDDENGDT